MAIGNTNREKKTNLYVERDVLGQEKTSSPSSPTKSHPNSIFIIIVLFIVAATVYWLLTGQ